MVNTPARLQLGRAPPGSHRPHRTPGARPHRGHLHHRRRQVSRPVAGQDDAGDARHAAALRSERRPRFWGSVTLATTSRKGWPRRGEASWSSSTDETRCRARHHALGSERLRLGVEPSLGAPSRAGSAAVPARRSISSSCGDGSCPSAIRIANPALARRSAVRAPPGDPRPGRRPRGARVGRTPGEHRPRTGRRRPARGVRRAGRRGHDPPSRGSRSTTARHAMPSARPIAPRPSARVAFTETGAPSARSRAADHGRNEGGQGGAPRRPPCSRR